MSEEAEGSGGGGVPGAREGREHGLLDPHPADRDHVHPTCIHPRGSTHPAPSHGVLRRVLLELALAPRTAEVEVPPLETRRELRPLLVHGHLADGIDGHSTHPQPELRFPDAAGVYPFSLLTLPKLFMGA